MSNKAAHAGKILRHCIFCALLLLFYGTPWKAEARTPLVSGNAMVEAVRAGKVDVAATLMLEGNYTANSMDTRHTPLLVIAAEEGHVPMVRLLLEKGARVNSRAKNNDTPLSRAVMYRREAVVKILLEHGALPDTWGSEQTPLIIVAVRFGHLGIMKALLEHGADINASDITGRTAVGWAKQKRNKKILQLLQTFSQNR